MSKLFKLYKKYFTLSSFAILFYSFGCNFKQKGSDFKGTIATPRELMCLDSWHYFSGNVSIFNGTRKTESHELSMELSMDKDARDLVFKLNDDSTVFYRTGHDTSFYNENGRWRFDQQDSSISIVFSEKNPVSPINCKLKEISGGYLTLEKTKYKDSLNKEVTTVWFSHS